MARHGKKPNRDGRAEDVSTSNKQHTPRTLSGTASTDSAPKNNADSVHDNREALRKSQRQTNAKDPFQAAVAQGIQDGNAWADNRMKRCLRQIVIAVMAIAVVCIAVFGVMGVRASQSMKELSAVNDCRDAVTAMNTSYAKDFQLKGKVVDAFSSMDSSYDLDVLSTVYQEEVKAPKTFDCKTDPETTANKANTAKAAYDKQAKAFKRALAKNEADQH